MNDHDFECLMSEARVVRRQYIGGLLRRAWISSVECIRFFGDALKALFGRSPRISIY